MADLLPEIQCCTGNCTEDTTMAYVVQTLKTHSETLQTLIERIDKLEKLAGHILLPRPGEVDGADQQSAISPTITACQMKGPQQSSNSPRRATDGFAALHRDSIEPHTPQSPISRAGFMLASPPWRSSLSWETSLAQSRFPSSPRPFETLIPVDWSAHEFQNNNKNHENYSQVSNQDQFTNPTSEEISDLETTHPETPPYCLALDSTPPSPTNRESQSTQPSSTLAHTQFSPDQFFPGSLSSLLSANNEIGPGADTPSIASPANSTSSFQEEIAVSNLIAFDNLTPPRIWSLSPLSVLTELEDSDETDQNPLEIEGTSRADLVQISSQNAGSKRRGRKRKVVDTSLTSAKRSRKNRRDSSIKKQRNFSWPKVTADMDGFTKFIECDGCRSWYHYGCVGVVPGDARVMNTEIFLCPPCSISTKGNLRGVDQSTDRCMRPGCNRGLRNEYFVEKIVGRMKGEAKKIEQLPLACEMGWIFNRSCHLGE